MYFPLFVVVLYSSLFCYALLCVHSSFAIILKRKRKLVALLLLSYRCIVTMNVLWLFLKRSWVYLQYMVFPYHTHLRFGYALHSMMNRALNLHLEMVPTVCLWLAIPLLNKWPMTFRGNRPSLFRHSNIHLIG